MTPEVDSRLLVDLHAGVHETPPWRRFLENLRLSVEGVYASMIFRPADWTSITHVYAGRRAPDDIHDLFVRKFKADPIRYRQMVPDRLYAHDQMLMLEDPLHRAFYEEVLAPAGMTHMRCVRIVEESGVNAWLTIAKPREFDAAQDALVEAVLSHVEIALKTFIIVERARQRNEILSTALDQLNVGWVTLNKDCHIVEYDDHARKLFERSKAMWRGKSGRLRLSPPTVDRQMAAIVKQFGLGDGGRAKALPVSRDPWMDMLIRPYDGGFRSTDITPVAVAYLRVDERSCSDRREQLMDLFDLSHSEARLAWNMIRGLSIAEAAEEAGIAIGTARGYSKKIYAKTGARGQPDLMRTLLTSASLIA